METYLDLFTSCKESWKYEINTDNQAPNQLSDLKRKLEMNFTSEKKKSKVSESSVTDYKGQNSRYLEDFEPLQILGAGGYGTVVLCKNKLDGRQYAVKRIRFKHDWYLREVKTLALMQHPHVVRYYQAWIETGTVIKSESNDNSSETYTEGQKSSETDIAGQKSSETYTEGQKSSETDTAGQKSSETYTEGQKSSETDTAGQKSSGTDTAGQKSSETYTEGQKSSYLFIQMEYCPRSLRQLLDLGDTLGKELAWDLFRQIVEGLAHIHAQGIIHGDLTPNNIFFDNINDIKIGDFNLAKFLKLDQPIQETAGTSIYKAPETVLTEKSDIYSLGVIFCELWRPFGTFMERSAVLNELKRLGRSPEACVTNFKYQDTLLKKLISNNPADRPSAIELLCEDHELLYSKFLDIIRTTEDETAFVNALFKYKMLSSHHHSGKMSDGKTQAQSSLETKLREVVVAECRGVFEKNSAKHFEIEVIKPLRLKDAFVPSRSVVKLLSQGRDIFELSQELRMPFFDWVAAHQVPSFKRYEISYVYRRGIDDTPLRYLQGDFDIIGGASSESEAGLIKVTMDILVPYFDPDSLDIHLNHGSLLDALLSWAIIKDDHRKKVVEALSVLRCLRPLSSEWKCKWVEIKNQLKGSLTEESISSLETAGKEFCGDPDQTLKRLRQALPADRTKNMLDELSGLFHYLKEREIAKNIYIDSFMLPTLCNRRDIFFQVYLRKKSTIDGTLLAVGGRYDHLLHPIWEHYPETTCLFRVHLHPALLGLVLHWKPSFDIFPEMKLKRFKALYQSSRHMMMVLKDVLTSVASKIITPARNFWLFSSNVKHHPSIYFISHKL